MQIVHMKWDYCFILKHSRNINANQVESLEHFTPFINFAKKKNPNQKALPPPHDLIITCTCKVFETSQRLKQQS